MFGGDEVSSLVFDLGTFNYRIGYSGEDTPRSVFQPIIGISQNNKKFFSETSLLFYKNDVEINYIMNNNGWIENYENFEEILENFEKNFFIEYKDHPILFSEPSLHNKDNRIKFTEFVFEKFNLPAIYLSKSAVLSAFSCGRSTCLVFDSGHNNTYAVPINDGYALQKSLIKCGIAGKYLTKNLKKKIQSKNINIIPFYNVDKIPINNNTENNNNTDNMMIDSNGNNINNNTTNLNQITQQPKYKTSINDLNPKESYKNFWINEIIRDLKETCLTTSEESMIFVPEENSFKASTLSPSITYEFPDGNTIELTEDRMSTVETVFHKIKEVNGFEGYHKMIMEAINKGDLELKKDLYNNIFLCGGNTLFGNFAERMQKSLFNSMNQNFRLKIITHPSNVEKKFSSWIGGSILTSLGTFHQLWLSKQEVDEHGAMIVERKCA